MEFEAYLDALASADPTPGGGSAATLVGALAAALCAMVARITLGSPKLAPVHDGSGGHCGRCRRACAGASSSCGRVDEAAFRSGRRRAGPAARDRRRKSRAHARRCSARWSAPPKRRSKPRGWPTDAFALTARTAELHNANLMSDVDCAMHFARAAFDASAANVEVNHRYITDAGDASRATARSARRRLAPRAAREFESRTDATRRRRPRCS